MVSIQLLNTDNDENVLIIADKSRMLSMEFDTYVCQ